MLHPTHQITLAFNSSQQLIILFEIFEMLCCKGYVRDMAVKYGIQVAYEGLARYLEYYLLHFISFKILAVSHTVFTI